MHVQELMTQPAVVCRPQDRLNRVAGLMWDHDIGVVAVVDGDQKLVGVITDRDICMAAYTMGRPIDHIPVEHVMAPQVVTCTPDEKIKTAEKKMRSHQVRRLPVVDADGRVQGMLSLNDVAREADREAARRHPEIGPRELTRTLAMVGQPRTSRESASAA